MPLTLRPYQREAVDETIAYFKKNSAPGCLVLPTGAGKSLVIASLALRAQGKVLVLAHVKELCQQNFNKHQLLAEESQDSRHLEAGIFSSGLGQKDAGRSVTFGSVQSVARNLREFGNAISLLVIDECHRVGESDSSQYSLVIAHLRAQNPKLRVLGLTATPYRLGMGWAYRTHARGLVRTDTERPFSHCIYEVSLKSMIEAGYLTRPIVQDAPIAQYDFSSLDAPGDRLFPDQTKSCNQLLIKHARVTKSIAAQIVATAEAEGRKGVMIFAATVDHAKEIANYLPVEETAIVLGETPEAERDERVHAFVDRKVRYLVNVSVLTTGFDAPHVDFVAILRPTESVSLFQQIVGRGLRLFPGKKDCLVVDYAGNGFDLFSPEVGEKKPNNESVIVAVQCPICSFENEFWGLSDEEGHVVEHYGRRCHGKIQSKQNEHSAERCGFRFRGKTCEKCGAENDIAARRCSACETAITDPDDQLKAALGLKDALVLRVSGMTLTVNGNRLTITYHDEDGASVSERFDFENVPQRAIFNREFARRLASGRKPLELLRPEHAIQLEALLPIPDFVVARQQKKSRARFFRVSARIFDYEGRRRLADKN